jgi:hypothetical protein
LGAASVATSERVDLLKDEQTVQSIMYDWHSDLEVYSQTFYEQVERMTEWDKVIFSNNETIYGLQQQESPPNEH